MKHPKINNNNNNKKKKNFFNSLIFYLSNIHSHSWCRHEAKCPFISISICALGIHKKKSFNFVNAPSSDDIMLVRVCVCNALEIFCAFYMAILCHGQCT